MPAPRPRPLRPLPFISATKERAAKATGLSEKALEEAAARGDLPRRYNGRRPIFMAEDLLKYVESLPFKKGG